MDSRPFPRVQDFTSELKPYGRCPCIFVVVVVGWLGLWLRLWSESWFVMVKVVLNWIFVREGDRKDPLVE